MVTWHVDLFLYLFAFYSLLWDFDAYARKWVFEICFQQLIHIMTPYNSELYLQRINGGYESFLILHGSQYNSKLWVFLGIRSISLYIVNLSEITWICLIIEHCTLNHWFYLQLNLRLCFLFHLVHPLAIYHMHNTVLYVHVCRVMLMLMLLVD